MKIDTFLLERNQTLYENDVELNLTESGIHPCTIRDILSESEIADLISKPLGYGYTDGSPRLRNQIAAWYPTAEAKNVAITQGASEANLLSVMSVLCAGDELLFVVPNFLQISGLARALGIRVNEFVLSGANGWQLDPERLAQEIKPNTKMIALVNPNNPTGVVQNTDTMQRIVNLAKDRSIYVLADEIYRGAEIDRKETPSFYGMYDRVIVTSSLSKAFANPGLRLGWAVAPEPVIDAIMQRQDYTSIGTSCLSQALAEKIMEPATRERILGRTRLILSRNIRLLGKWMELNHNAFTWTPPHAGGMAFLGYDFPISSEEFSRKLREEESLFVVAGSWFGLEKHIRIGLGVETAHLEEALKRISRFTGRFAN